MEKRWRRQEDGSEKKFQIMINTSHHSSLVHHINNMVSGYITLQEMEELKDELSKGNTETNEDLNREIKLLEYNIALAKYHNDYHNDYLKQAMEGKQREYYKLFSTSAAVKTAARGPPSYAYTHVVKDGQVAPID